MVRAMRALEAVSQPGEVVLQRPGARYPPAPVILIGRLFLLQVLRFDYYTFLKKGEARGGYCTTTWPSNSFRDQSFSHTKNSHVLPADLKYCVLRHPPSGKAIMVNSVQL